MAHAPLAVAADLTARGVDVSNTARINTALAVASAAVREAADAVISEVESTLTLRGSCDTFLQLPGPVTAVSAVTLAGAVVTAHEVETDGLYLGSGWGRGDIVVTFTHGLAEVPADIVDLTCDLAKEWLDHQDDGGGSTAGRTSLKVDDFAEGYSDESAGQVSPVYVPELTRNWLRARFGGGATVVGTR